MKKKKERKNLNCVGIRMNCWQTATDIHQTSARRFIYLFMSFILGGLLMAVDAHQKGVMVPSWLMSWLSMGLLRMEMDADAFCREQIPGQGGGARWRETLSYSLVGGRGGNQQLGAGGAGVWHTGLVSGGGGGGGGRDTGKWGKSVFSRSYRLFVPCKPLPHKFTRSSLPLLLQYWNFSKGMLVETSKEGAYV